MSHVDRISDNPSGSKVVFDQLHDEIVSLKLLPGTKLSEVDVARRFGVSRQPVVVLPAIPTCEQMMLCFPIRQLWAIMTRLSIFVPSPITVGP